jgi:hypothetical protein
VPAQQLRQILRKRRARQDHVTPYLVRLLLEIALHVREKSDNGRSLLQLALQLWDERKRLRVDIIKIEDDQGGLLFAILLHALGKIFIVLDELDFHVQLAPGFLDLGRKEEVVDECKDARSAVLADGQWIRFDGCVRRGETRTLPPRPLPVAVPGKCRAITVIHRRGVNAVLIVT